MMNKIYCYHCMTYHLPENMRQIMTRTGLRWRCIRSIEAARNTAAERDAFGARQTLELLPITGDLELLLNSIGRLSANREPVLCTIGIDLDDGGVLGRVVLTDLLDHGAITALAGIDNDDTVERCTDLTHALKTNLDCHLSGHSLFLG